jgi:hypothetical protein
MNRKPIKDIPEPRLKKPKFEYIDKKKLVKLEKPERDWSAWLMSWIYRPPWKRDGFKRVTGFVIGLSGLVLKLIPEYEAIGEIILYVGSALGIGGMVHGKVKNKKNVKQTQIFMKILGWIAELLTKLFSKKEKQNGRN